VHTLVPIAVMTCPDCQHQFPAQAAARAYRQRSPTSLSQRFAPKIETFKVIASIQQAREEGSPTVCAWTITGNLRRFTEWVCFSHEGYARKKAVDWFANRCADLVSRKAQTEMIKWINNGIGFFSHDSGREHVIEVSEITNFSFVGSKVVSKNVIDDDIPF